MKHTIKVGKLEIELPDYMISLNQEQIDEIFQTAQPEIGIIACGLHSDKNVTLITTKGEVKTFQPSKYSIPEGVYLPLPGGEEVYLPNTANRWPGLDRGFQVKSSWLLEHSQPELINATMKVHNSYVGDVTFTSAEINGS